jgi:microcystin-dependent protein
MSVQNESSPLDYPIPIGTILPYIGSVASVPLGWLPCNNSAYLISDYPELYSLIGTHYGGAPAGQFRTPILNTGGYIRGSAITNTAVNVYSLLAQITDIPITTANLPQLTAANFQFNSVNATFNNSIYSFDSDNDFSYGAIFPDPAIAIVKANSEKITTYGVTYDAGSSVSFTNNLKTDAFGEVEASVILKGYTMLYIIKAYDFPVIPPGAPVAPQVPNPTRVYFDCPELSGYIIQ